MCLLHVTLDLWEMCHGWEPALSWLPLRGLTRELKTSIEGDV